MVSRFGPYPKKKPNGTPLPEEVPVLALRGEKGDKGDRGEMGRSIIGPQGPKGDPGQDGENGVPGKDGTDGIDGLRGPVGPMGSPGVRGEPGPKGDKGDQGEPGPAGPAGSEGKAGLSGGALGGGPVGINIVGTTGRTKEVEFAGAGAPTVTYTRGTKKALLTFAAGGTPSEITDIPTAEVDTDLRLAPDGVGGVGWAAGGGGGAPTNADYLVGTAQGGLSAEIAVGTSPGGELGGTWASPTVDATHSGSTHAATQAAAESTAATALSDHAGASDPHAGYQKESEKASASGYASLDAGTKVPLAQLPTGITSATVALGDAAAALDATHAGAADPHTGYQKESEKGAASGYASLGSDSLVPQDQLGSGAQDGTKFLRDDGTWQAPTAAHPDLATHDTLGLATQAELDAHIDDTADAHDASAISILDSAADFTATDVEGALAELQADNEAHVAAADPHTGYRLESADHSHASSGAQGGTIAHSALTGLTSGDDHTQYQKESEKAAASGYAGLGSNGLVPVAQLGTGTPDGTKFLRDDQTYVTPSGGGAPTTADYLVGTAQGGLSAEIVVGTAPGGELGGTWASPTVDATHSGTPHTNYVEKAGGVFDAGSASAGSWPQLTAGTLLTTPEAGALELDANNLYGTTDAGNRGYIPIRHFIRADSTRTFTSNTNSQPIFTSPANGRITLETGCYRFSGLLAFSSMSSSSGNLLVDMLGAGNATVAAWLWQSWGRDTAAGSAGGAVGGTWMTSNASPAAVVSAGTGTAAIVSLDGTFEVTGAGTMIPAITLATAAAAVLGIGSYISIERIGSTSVVSVGQWD